jgi:heme/copper-type cytochrome/quinol oxidase subunit 2
MLNRSSIATHVALTFAIALASTGGLRAQDEGEGAEVRRFRMDVENWQWIPDQIVVPLGAKVVIEIRSYHATHRFDLKDYGLRVVLPQDQTTTVEFVANKAGTFKWRCGRPCGDGCPRMTGTLVVSTAEADATPAAAR